jgi:putative transcriptional regulator
MSPAEPTHDIQVALDEVLDERGMSLADLARAVDITYANLSVLKNGHAKAIRFSTLAAICEALECQPGDVLRRRAR